MILCWAAFIAILGRMQAVSWISLIQSRKAFVYMILQDG